MAAMSDISEHSLADMQSDDDGPASESVLALQLARTPDHGTLDLLRPSLAETQKIGFFSLDRATQTHDTEIIDMKQMTESVHQLLEDADQMKRDIHFAQNVMQADFDARLQRKSIELYVRVNDKISELERMHEERVATVRRAFKQQLADAIARIHTLYNDDTEDNQRDLDQRLNREKRRKDAKAGKWENKVLDLQATIEHNETVIEMLKAQIAEYQENDVSRTPSVHIDESQLDELREDVEQLQKKISRMDRALQAKDEVTDDLNNEILKLHNELERERVMVEQLNQEKGELQEASDANKAAAQRQMENQSLSMQKGVEESIRQARSEAYEEARSQMAEVQGGDRQRIQQLRDEKKMLEQLLIQERERKEEKPQETLDLEKAKRNEQKLMAEIAKLKKEIERVHKTWEKKFAILQQSLHALKDESYLRQTMQRQAAQLHQASISFAYDAPLGITPNKSQPRDAASGSKRPLPDIGKGQQPQDYMSYTVSAPSGRATGLYSLDENQVMSDTEQELPDGIVPLPPPPSNRVQSDCSEDIRRQEGVSRSSSRSHVVVLPSVEAQ